MENLPTTPPETTEAEKRRRVRELNDALRTTFSGGHVLLTSGVQALGERSVVTLLRNVRSFSAFTRDNDPYGEHDFGALEHEGHKVFWKIDYYDRTLSIGSDDPSDPSATCRVLTIMLVEEY